MILGVLRFVLLSILSIYTCSGAFAQWNSSPSPTLRDHTSVHVINELEAVLASTDGIYRTKDGGSAWKRYRLQRYSSDSLFMESMVYKRLHFISAEIGIAAGWSSFNRPMILKTVNGGIDWKIAYLGPVLGDKADVSFRAITFVNANVGYVAGTKGTVMKTVDGGETWNPVNVVLPASEVESSYFSSVFFLDELTGYVAGSGIHKTQDGGKTWNRITAAEYSQATFDDIHFFDQNNGIAALDFPQFSDFEALPLYKTTDGGYTWSPVQQPGVRYEGIGEDEISDLHFIDRMNGYAVGDRVAWKTIDGGETWESLTFTPSDPMAQIHSFGDKKAMMVGEYGRIYSTSNLSEVTRPISRFALPETSYYCPNTPYTFLNKGPKYNSYKWYVDDILVSTDYNLTTTFASDKRYEVKLVAEKNGITDFSIKYVRAEPTTVFQRFNFAYYQAGVLYCRPTPLDLTIYGMSYLNFNAGDKARYELWAEGKLIEVEENKTGTISFNRQLLQKTITYTVKATIQSRCQIYTQEESITFNVAPVPNLTLEVQEMEDLVCPSSSEGFKIKIKNSQVGFMYAVKHSNIGGTADYDTPYEGNGGDLIITTPFKGQDEYANTTATTLSEREIIVYAWSNKCSNYDAHPLQDKAVMRTSNFNMKIEVENNHLLVNQPLNVTNLSVADEFKWTVTDGANKTEYTTTQLPQITFTTPGVKLIELFVSKHGKCTNVTRFEVVVGTVAPTAALATCSDQDISPDPNKLDSYVRDGVYRIVASYTDSNGFIYTTGSQRGRIFLSKYDSSGKLLWTKNHWSGGYHGNSIGSAITTDNEGNVYLGGHSNTERFTFGSIKLESDYNNYFSFIIKLNPAGNTLWAIRNDSGESGGSAWMNRITDITIDAEQNVYAVFKSSRAGLTFADGSTAWYAVNSPKYNYEFIWPTFLLKTNKQGINLGVTILYENGITHDLNHAAPYHYFLSWGHQSSPQIEVKDDKLYIIGSRKTKKWEPFYIVNYKMEEDAKLMQKYPDGGIQGYVAIMDLKSGEVVKAFNTFFQEELPDTWYGPNQWAFTVPYALTPEGIIVGYSWGYRYGQELYNGNEFAEDVVVGNNLYKDIKRGSLTAAYDWNGNNLWSATSHDAFINSFYYSTGTAKLYAYTRLNNFAMIGSAGTQNYSLVNVANGINTGLIVYDANGKVEAVNQTTGQFTSEIPYSMIAGQCDNLYLLSGILTKAVNPNTDHDYVYNNNTRLRTIALSGKCNSADSATVPFSQKNICNGESVQLSVIAPNTTKVTWSPAESLDDPSSSTPIATPSVSTTYLVKIETTEGCTITRTIQVNVDEPLIISDTFVATTKPYSTGVDFKFPVIEGGTNYTYKWDFGDGTQSNSKNIYDHTFPANGTYTVSLTISNTCTEKQIKKEVSVPCTPVIAPTAGIGFKRTNTVVSFELLNPQNVESWEWDFGDGITSTERNPVHTFVYGWAYSVKLKVRSACVENIYYANITVTCPTIVNPTLHKMVNRQNVTFWTSDIPEEYVAKWNFSDGTESTEKQPVHTFEKPGKYSATLLIEHECGTTTRTIDVEVTCTNLVTDFNAIIDQAKVKFVPPANSGTVTYKWDFGDGNISMGVSPEHTYMQSGKYLVWLTLTDACVPIISSKEITVCTETTSSDFTFTIDKNDSHIITFRPNNTQTGVTYLWNFGDGTTSTEVVPQHRYAVTGSYNVCLTTNSSCSTDTKCQEVNMPTATVDDVNNKLLMIYPNPANEMLYFDIAPEVINTVVGITVHDVLGREVLTKSVKSLAMTKMIDTRELSPGSYYIRLSIKKGNYIIKKFVVKH